MSKNPNKPGSFFHELKRRNVFRVLAMYAGAAFVIIELTNNVVDPLRLPGWLPTVIILLLIVGFPVTAVLSWIFDLTPKGIQRTEPLEEHGEVMEPEVKHRRSLRISDVIIVVLLIAVGVLVYPKIFNRDDFKSSRNNDGRVSLAILQFENLTGDTLLNVWQSGLQDLLITGLSNSEELSVRQYQSTNSVVDQSKLSYAGFSAKLVKEVATLLDVRNLVKGTLMKAGAQIRMDAKIIDAETNEIYKTFLVQGSSEDDLFMMVDSLSWQIKNYVEIKNIKEKRNSSILQAEGYTRSAEAFKYYMNGLDALMNMDMEQGVEWLSRALGIDSTFTNAQVLLAHALHNNNQDGKARELVTGIYKKKDTLPVAEKLITEHLNAYYFQTPYEEMKYAKQLIGLDDLNPMYLHMLAVAHYKVFEYDDAVLYWEKLFELHEKWGSQWQNPFTYFMLADAYLKMNEYAKGNQIIQAGYGVFPRNGYIQTFRVMLALVQEDTSKLGETIEEYLSFRHNVTNCPEALITNDMGYIYTQARHLDEAEKQYRLAIQQDPKNLSYQFNLAKFLIDEDIQVDEGLEIVDRLLENLPGQWALLSYKGWGLYKKEKYDEALELLRAGWEKKPIYNHLYYLHLQEAEKAASASG